MKLSLRSAIPADASTLTDIYFSAFSTDAISLRCFPRNNPAVYDFWQASVIEEMRDPTNHFLCVVLTYDDDDDYNETAANINPNSALTYHHPHPPPPHIIAYAKWVDPSAPIVTSLPTWPVLGDAATLANHFFGSLVARHERLMSGRKHWYLELIATRPEYQKRGAAGMLLRWGLERADAEGVETYLEASPSGKPVYEHLGFREVERLVVLEGSFEECMMVRGVKGMGGRE